MKMDWNRIALTSILVMIAAALVFTPAAMAAHGGGMHGGGMGGGGMGGGGIHSGGMGGGQGWHGGGGGWHGGGGGWHGGGWRHGWNRPWWNNWGWGGWWGGGYPWYGGYGGGICPYPNCVSQGYSPEYCAQVCGGYA